MSSPNIQELKKHNPNSKINLSSALGLDMKNYDKRITNFKDFYNLFLRFEKDNNYAKHTTRSVIQEFYKQYKILVEKNKPKLSDVEKENLLFKKVEDNKTELNKIYYGKVLMANLKSFYEKVKEEGLKIPYEIVKLYYNNQQVHQVFKPYVKPKTFHHIIAYYPFEKYYFDTMYLKLDKSTLAFVNIVDCFSKFAFSKIFTLPKKSQAIGSDKAVETFKEFIAEIKKYGYQQADLGMAIFDAGSEFEKDCLEFVNTEKLLHYYAGSEDKRYMAIVERFNKTLRLYLEKYRFVNGRITNKVLKEIIDAYNNIPHAKLKDSPIGILTDKEKEENAVKHFAELQKENISEPLPIGSFVRVKIEPKTFQKAKAVWSKDIYEIKNIINGNRYELKDVNGVYYKDDLQVVKKERVMDSKSKNFEEE